MLEYQERTIIQIAHPKTIHETKALLEELNDHIFLYQRKLEIHFERLAHREIIPEIQSFFNERGIVTKKIEYVYNDPNGSTLTVHLNHAQDWDYILKENLIDKLEGKIQTLENGDHVYHLLVY